MSSKGWAIFFAVLTAVLLGLWFLPKGSAQRVGIYQNGQLLYTAELTEPQTFTVSGPAGENRITVENGTIYVSCADCPDQTCVRHGVLTASGGPIVCLPNRLVIRYFTEPTGPDAVSGRAG